MWWPRTGATCHYGIDIQVDDPWCCVVFLASRSINWGSESITSSIIRRVAYISTLEPGYWFRHGCHSKMSMAVCALEPGCWCCGAICALVQLQGAAHALEPWGGTECCCSRPMHDVCRSALFGTWVLAPLQGAIWLQGTAAGRLCRRPSAVECVLWNLRVLVPLQGAMWLPGACPLWQCTLWSRWCCSRCRCRVPLEDVYGRHTA